MKVVLIFAVIAGWASGAVYQSDNWAIKENLAKTINENMELGTTSCSNFYESTCGKWSDVHGNEHSSVRGFVDYQAEMDLIRYMDNTYMKDKPEFVKKVYQFYTSCTDVDDYNELYYMKWLEEHEHVKWALLATSPEADAVTDSDTDEEFDWVRTFAILQRYGMNDVFIYPSMLRNKSEQSQNILDLSKPSNFVTLNYEDMLSLNNTVKLPSDFEPIEKLWKDISDFEMRLVELNEEGVDNLLTTNEEIPLPWLKMFDFGTEINIGNMHYMKALDGLLKNYNDKFICRYLEVRFLWSLYRNNNDFTEVNCMKYTISMLPAAIDWIFGQIYPELEQEIPEINEMFGNIVKHINETVHTDRMDVVSYDFIEKLDSLQLKIGNYPRVDTIKVMDTFFADLIFNGSDFYGNFLLLTAFVFDKIRMSPTNKVDIENVKEFFDPRPLSAEDYQVFQRTPEHVLIINLGFLRQPFYHWGYSTMNKYAVLGSILARNIYDDIYIHDLDALEKQTFAHVGGIHSAFQAYFSSFPNEDSALEETMKRQFFHHAAQWYCDGSSNTLLNDIVSQLPEFTETFECKRMTFFEIFSQ